jgi:hypothetical protein
MYASIGPGWRVTSESGCVLKSRVRVQCKVADDDKVEGCCCRVVVVAVVVVIVVIFGGGGGNRCV